MFHREPRNHKWQSFATVSLLRDSPMSIFCDMFWIMVSSALLSFLLPFSTLLCHEPLGRKWRHWTGKTVQSYVAVSVTSYFYFYGWEARVWKYLACSYLWVMLKYPSSWLVGKLRRIFSVWKNVAPLAFFFFKNMDCFRWFHDYQISNLLPLHLPKL